MCVYGLLGGGEKMNKFVALRVGSGDAFYLEREEASILFDGGGSEKKFPSLFGKELNLTHVDIIVCSHNDSDHVNGIIGYLNSSLTCKEVWLPANWVGKIDTLLSNPEMFFEELVMNIKDDVGIEYLEDSICSAMFENRLELNIENLVKKSNESYLNFKNFRNNFSYLTIKHHKLFSKLFASAMRIKEITSLAYKKSLKVRWFQYDPAMQATGGENYFKPVNSIEINKLYSKKMSAFQYLTLTRSNKESLVFYSPKIESLVDGVLFSADSDYSFDQNIPSDLGKNPIITVPHHGSKSNEKAYNAKQLKTYVSNTNTILVRSDGSYKNRPGKNYKSFKLNKFCTRCNGYKTGQTIVMTPTNRSWTSSNYSCSC